MDKNDLKEKFCRWLKESKKFREEFHMLQNDYCRQKKELQRQQREIEKRFKESCGSGGCGKADLDKLHEEFRMKQKELCKRFREHRKSKIEFYRMHRHVKNFPLILVCLNLFIWYLTFKYAGVKTISVFFALLTSMAVLREFFFLIKIKIRILAPLDMLKSGLEEIAKGNFNVKVESNVPNEISLLIDSFNEMAQKLMESEKIKAEYEENRKTLIASISHDLKTPITSIQGYIEAITEGNVESSEDINKYLRIIYNNSRYMNKLIDDLFLFSKLDMQKLEFQFIIINVRTFVNDLMEEFKLELEEMNIKFLYSDNMEEDCSFNIDRKRLHQVFRNIIGNAIKYGPNKDLLISTELYRLDNYVYIDIRDNGPGISEDKLPHIFDRFYRIDTERTKDFMSTGLGLAIAKELVEANGGRISASSVENKGTCFTIMLPVTK